MVCHSDEGGIFFNYLASQGIAEAVNSAVWKDPSRVWMTKIIDSALTKSVLLVKLK